MNNSILSVSDFITRINIGLRKAKVKIIGEILKVNKRNHIYFNLRDEKEESSIHCILWKSRYDYLGVELKEGTKVIISGFPEIYKATGSLSFITTSVELVGEGILKKEYEKLKSKLEKEGLFEKKKKLPLYPQKIGIITSLKGAVIADFSNNLGRYGFKIKMINSRVEGQEALSDLLSAVKRFRKEDIDILIIMRGGGALEKLAPLMPFNNEFLVREVVSFPVPVITAIGHHKDNPLLSMASSLNVSTPSIAATIINKSWDEISFLLEREERKIIHCYKEKLDKDKDLIDKTLSFIKNYKEVVFKGYKREEDKFLFSLSNFNNILKNVKIILREKKDSFLNYLEERKEELKKELERKEKIISINNPERQLSLGYTITKIRGKILRDIKGLKKEDKIETILRKGKIISKVEKYEKRFIK